MSVNNLTPQINLSIEQTVDKIKDSIANKKPLALIRFGDGEGIFMRPETQSPEFWDKIKDLKQLSIESTMEQKWFRIWHELTLRLGFKWPQDAKFVYEQTHQVLVNSMRDADIIGIHPILPRFIPVRNWCQSIAHYKSLGIDLDGKDICHHEFARQPQFHNLDNLKVILNGSSLHIISLFCEQLKQSKLEERLECEISYTQTDNKQIWQNKKDILSQFDQIQADVVFYGYSVSGKDFALELKRRGKVAIDCGAALGRWCVNNEQ